MQMFRNRSYVIALGLALTVGLCSCRPPRRQTPSSPTENKDPSAAALGLEQVAWTLYTGQALYMFDDEAPPAKLALGVKLETPGRIWGNYILKDVLPEDALTKFANNELTLRNDHIGSFSRVELPTRGSELDATAIQSRTLTNHPDILAVLKKGSPLSQAVTGAHFELRRIAEVDSKVGGLTVAGQNMQMPQLISALKRDLDDPSHPLHNTKAIRVGISDEGVDLDTVIARVQHEFGDRYALTPMPENSFKLEPFEESYVLEYRSGASDGAAASSSPLQAGLGKGRLHRALLNPDFVASGNSRVILSRPGQLNTQVLDDSGLYWDIRKVNTDELKGIKGLDVRKLGLQDWDVHVVTRQNLQRFPKGFEVPDLELVLSDRALFFKSRDTLANAFLSGHEYIANLELMAAKPDHIRILGEGGNGIVVETSRNGVHTADKVMKGRLGQGQAQELASAILLGHYGIGPRIHYANTKTAEVTYIADLARGDAASVPMSQSEIISYAVRQNVLRRMGLVALDDKPQNILLMDNQAYMSDFDFLKIFEPGKVPRAKDFGTYVPKEVAEIEMRGSDAYPAYTAEQLQSFFFGFSVLQSRLKGTHSGNYFKDNFYYADLQGRSLLDGDKLVAQLRWLGKGPADAGMTPEAFTMLTDMLSNTPSQRPSVSAFRARFENSTFITGPPVVLR